MAHGIAPRDHHQKSEQDHGKGEGKILAGEEIGAFAVFVTIASATVAAPVIVYLIMGERVQGGLNSLKEWLIANNNTVMAVLLVVFGAKLIGDAISILSN